MRSMPLRSGLRRIIAWLTGDPAYRAYLEAVQAIDHLEARRAMDDRSLLRFGDACARAGDYERAAEAYFEVAKRFATSGQVNKEVALLKRACLCAPRDLMIRMNLGCALEQVGRKRESAAHYVAAADMLVSASPFDAFNLLRHALELDPALADARARQGEILRAQATTADLAKAIELPAEIAADTLTEVPNELLAVGPTTSYSAGELDDLLHRVEELGSVTVVFDDIPNFSPRAG
jgi:tetratricopeptide (TPR) repeat protein